MARARGPAVVVAIAAAYCAWLGAHWLRFSYSSDEFAIAASRLLDVERGIREAHRLPWWTGTFQDGSSEALVYATGLTLVPMAILAPLVGPLAAAKLVALLAIGASGITMFFGARYFLQRELAAVLAAIVYMLQPVLLVRAASTEHLTVIAFAPLVPLAWLCTARVLNYARTGGGEARFADSFALAVTLAAMTWTQNKQTAVQILYLAAFALLAFARSTPWERRAQVTALLTSVALFVPLVAFAVVPTLLEVKHLKLFAGDPVEAWQYRYSVQSPGAIVHRAEGEWYYSSAVALCLGFAAVAAPSPGGARRDRRLLLLAAASFVFALAAGNGPLGIWHAVTRAGSPSTVRSIVVLVALAAGCALYVRRELRGWRARIATGGAFLALLFVPWFDVLELLPPLRGVRAPSVFYELPGAFFVSLLAGFLGADVLEPRFGARAMKAVIAATAVLLFADTFPFEKQFLSCNVPPATLEHARALYASLGARTRADAEHHGSKAYFVSSRFFHILGPSWGGPALATEGGVTYMAPEGTGLLAIAASKDLALQRAYFDLVGARWIVFDKSDPLMQTPNSAAQLAAYRKVYPLASEDEDFAVFEVPHARAYVSGYAHAAIAAEGTLVTSELALRLAHDGYMLVDSGPQPPALPSDIETVTVSSEPAKIPREDTLSNVTVSRPNDEAIALRFVASRASIAVVDESDYPYWHARLDGRPAPILRASYGLMGFAVDAGAHELTLSYEPPAAHTWSAILSLAALLMGSIAAAVSARAGATSRT